MASGIVSGAWGYSPKMVAGIDNTLESKDTPLTYQLGMTSTYVKFDNGEYNSPLYSAFGKKMNKIKETTKDISYLKRV